MSERERHREREREKKRERVRERNGKSDRVWPAGTKSGGLSSNRALEL